MLSDTELALPVKQFKSFLRPCKKCEKLLNCLRCHLFGFFVFFVVLTGEKKHRMCLCRIVLLEKVVQITLSLLSKKYLLDGLRVEQ